MRTVLVTGGAGFIGSHLVEALTSEGVPVRVFDNFSSGARSNLERPAIERRLVQVVEGDIRDESAMTEAAVGCSAIVHLAALVSVQESVADPRRCFDVNAKGTLNALEAAREHGVERFVLASSAAVYGDDAPVPVAEGQPLAPLTPYGATKAEGEMLCRTWHAAYGVSCFPLRFFNVFGEHQDPSGPYAAVISKFASCFEAGQRPTIFGDGLQTRDFVYVRDVVRAVIACLSAVRAPSCEPINIGTGHETSLLDLVRFFGDAWDRPLAPRHADARAGDIRNSCAVVERASERLGFRATTSMVDGLRAIRATQSEGSP